ncbi:MAG: DUF47 domain-containing protein, partial [Candidatus Altarchaeaceae archaeon]
LAGKVVEATEKQEKILKNYSLARIKEDAKEVKKIEHEADEIAAKIYNKAHKSFMTPIDLEYIIGLTNALDNIVDKIEKFVSMCDVFELKNVDEYMLKFGNLLKETSLIVQELVSYLRNAEKNKGKISEACNKLMEKEREGDEIHKEATRALFKSSDVIYILKMKEIYKVLEDATDACRSVANEASDIIAKLA